FQFRVRRARRVSFRHCAIPLGLKSAGRLLRRRSYCQRKSSYFASMVKAGRGQLVKCLSLARRKSYSPPVVSRVAGLDGDEGSAAGGGGFAVGRDGRFDDGAVVC